MVIFIGNKNFTEGYVGNKKITEIWKGNEKVRPGEKVKTLPIVYSVESALSDFPIYIKPSAITGFGSITLAEAQSLRFYADSAKTVELPRDIVSADEIYVKNTLATGTGNKLYLDWDGVSSDYAVSDTYGRNNVYTKYKAFYDFASGNSNDRTGNGYNGTDSNITYSGDYASFNGSSSKITLPYLTLTDSFSLNFLINRTGSRDECILRNGNSYTGGGFSYNGRDLLIKPDYRFNFRSQGLSATDTHSTTATLTGLKNVYIIYNGSNMKYYIDGILNSSHSRTGTPGTGDSIKTIGGPPFRDGYALNGNIGKVNIAHIALSEDRVSTEYANQSNPATFFGTLS